MMSRRFIKQIRYVGVPLHTLLINGFQYSINRTDEKYGECFYF